MGKPTRQEWVKEAVSLLVDYTAIRCMISFLFFFVRLYFGYCYQKVQAGNDQEKAQSERNSHSKNRGGKKPN